MTPPPKFVIIQLPRFRSNGGKLHFTAQDNETFFLPTTQELGVEVTWTLYERWGYLIHSGAGPLEGHYQFYDAKGRKSACASASTPELAKRAYCVAAVLAQP